jgi:multidrug resistance protein MdtO
MVTARDRVIGILMGNLVAYLMFVHVWPVSIARRIDPAIGHSLRSLSGVAQSASLSGRRALAAQTLSALSSAEDNLGLLAYEPPSARPSDAWRASRSRTLRSLAAVSAPLLLAADRDSEACRGFARRLDRLADALAPDSSSSPPIHSEASSRLAEASNAPSNPLWRLVNEPLTALENSVALVVAPQRIQGHARA